MTLHLISFPHTRLDGGYECCAYTQKIRKVRRMDLGRDLVVYGTEGADVEIAAANEPNDGRLPAWPEDWMSFNARAGEALRANAEPRDLLLLAGGWSQRPIADELPGLIACEPGVGYEGIATEFCAFESNAWRHYVYGLKGIGDGRWFDTVIPNYFDPADFPHVNQGGGDYLLFVGRRIQRKGVQAAVEIAQAYGLPLVVAGPGDDTFGDAEYIGPVAAVERAELMAGAVALIAPTLYLEPFGGVAVEAQMCGTPAITPDFGAFTETVDPEWRFNTLAEAVAAVERARTADHLMIRAQAISRYSIDAVAPLYRRWFDRLETLHGSGWYELDRPMAALT